MDPILDKVRAGQNALEQLASAIPGFSGYREKELRRDADRLQREYLAARLGENKKALNELAAGASRQGTLDVINDIETARKRLDKVASRILYADRGYAGFFDPVKVDEAALARVYDFDLKLLEGVDQVRAAADAALGQKAGLQALITALDALDSRLGERDQILRGIH
jgi:hypothetical protein